MTLPIGGRIALPSSINTYISVVKNTSLMYVIGYPELTTTAINIANLTLETLEALTVLGDRLPRARLEPLGRDPRARGPARAPGDAASHARLGGARRPLHPRGRAPGDAPHLGDLASSAATVIGIVLGTLLTIQFRPSRMLIRGYIEVFRGLPILVTVFIVYFGLPSISPSSSSARSPATAIALILWGSAQVAEATRGAVQSIPREQHEAAAALGFGWVGRHRSVILPQALRRLLPPLVSLLVNIIQNSTLAAVIGGHRAAPGGEGADRAADVLPAGRDRRDPRVRDLRRSSWSLFFLISFPLTRLAAYLEKRLV